MSFIGNAVDAVGNVVGTAVEKTTGVVFKTFSAVKTFAATATETREERRARKQREKEEKKRKAAEEKRKKEAEKKRRDACRKACDIPPPPPPPPPAAAPAAPAPPAAAPEAPAAAPAAMETSTVSAFGAFCAEPNPADCKSGFGAVGDEEVTDEQARRRLREAAFRKAAEEAESGKWNSGSWDRVRKSTWSGQAERGLPVPSAPATYQQAILSQPIPMLSPLRGTNQPQGVRAIVDATMGTTTTTYNPNLPALAVAIPANATAGSLAADIKVNVVGGAPTSNFAALFG